MQFQQNWTIKIQILAYTILTILFYKTKPYIRSFSIDDPSISLPLVKETISANLVTFVSFILPLLCMFAIFRINKNKNEQIYYFYFIAAHLLNTTVFSFIKVAIGRLRPDFLARCLPIDGICTGDPLLVLEGRKSFPSGHSAISFCGSIFTLLAIKDIFKKKVFTYIAALVLLSWALFVASSRVYDGRHHLLDVSAGFVLGASFSLIMYKAMLAKKNDEETLPVT